MKRSIWIHWLRFWAYVLDSVGRKHSIRRRLGQLLRVRKESGATSGITNAVPPSLSVAAPEAKP